MTINTTAGKTYAVTPAADCTVTTPAGTLIATCPAGEQTLFVAPATEIEVSDDTALVTESFKGASVGLSASRGSGLSQEECDARYGRIGTSNTWDGDQTINGDLTVTGITDLGNIRTLNISTQRTDVDGPASFAHSVTMAQTLNVAGETILRTLEILGGQYSVFTVETARATWTNTQAGHFRLQADKAGEQEVILELGRSKVDDRACLIKPGQSGPLTERDVPNCQEGDARWVKFNNTLTDAEYAALAVKDQTTLYITSDGGKVYIGSYALN